MRHSRVPPPRTVLRATNTHRVLPSFPRNSPCHYHHILVTCTGSLVLRMPPAEIPNDLVRLNGRWTASVRIRRRSYGRSQASTRNSRLK